MFCDLAQSTHRGGSSSFLRVVLCAFIMNALANRARGNPLSRLLAFGVLNAIRDPSFLAALAARSLRSQQRLPRNLLTFQQDSTTPSGSPPGVTLRALSGYSKNFLKNLTSSKRPARKKVKKMPKKKKNAGKWKGKQPARPSRPPRQGPSTMLGSKTGAGLTEGGSRTLIVRLNQIKTTISADGSGNYGAKVFTLNTDLFTKCASFAALYDQVRLRSLSVRLLPMLSMTAKGIAMAYFDYRSADSAVTTLADASLMQDVKVAPVRSQLVIKWKKQSNVDDEYITSAASTAFNSKTGHALCIVVSGADNGALLYQVEITGVLEFTGFTKGA